MSDWADGGATASQSYSEKPNWLKNDPENPSQKDWTPETEIDAGVDPLSTVTPDQTAEDDSSGGGKCRKLFLFGISAVFLAFFVYATINEKNDNGTRLQYEIFMGTSAGLPLLFLVHWMLCFPEKLVQLLATGMFVWGTVLMVMVILDFTDLDKDSEERPDRIYEIAVIAASLFSSLYHPCVMKCCIEKK